MPQKTFQSQEEREQYLTHRRLYNQFVKSLQKYILTSRFNNDTFYENTVYRNNHSNVGCIYCSPVTVSKKVPIDNIMFVLEMNNSVNKIMGIGLVKNHPICGKYKVYNSGNYNRYVYWGKNRIDRSEMLEEEEKIMQALDILCFKGYHHSKRGQGLRLFPLNMQYNCRDVIDLVEYISNMFRTRLANTSIENK
jgi:hypothetical protein